MRLTDIASRLAEIREYISKRSAAGSDFSDVITIDTLYADINILHGEVADAVRAEALLPTMYLAQIDDAGPRAYVVRVTELGTGEHVAVTGEIANTVGGTVDHALRAVGFRMAAAPYRHGTGRYGVRYLVVKEG
jgi:hypothetical protein